MPVNSKILSEKTDSLSQDGLSFFDITPSALILIDGTGQILSINQYFIQVYGASKVVGKKLTNIIHTDDSEDVKKLLSNLSDDLNTVPISFKCKLRHFSVSAATYKVVTINVGRQAIILDKVECFVLSVEPNISHDWQINSQYEALLKAFPDLLFKLSRTGVYLDCYANDQAQLAFDIDFLLGKSVSDLFSSELANKSLVAIAHALETGEVQQLEYEFVADGKVKDSSAGWYNARYSKCGKDEVLMIIRNVSDRKQEQDRLSESIDRFEMVSVATRDAIYDVDFGTELVHRNAHYAEAYGAPQSEHYTAGSWYCRIHPEDQDRVIRSNKAALKAIQTFWIESYRLKRIDNTWAWVEDRAYIIRDDNGEPVRMVGACSDITDKVEARSKLVESKAKWQSLIEQIPDQVALVNLEGVVTYINRSMLDNIPGAEMTGRPAEEYVVDKKRYRTYFKFVQNRGRKVQYETTVILSDGTKRWVWMAMSPIWEDGNITSVLIMIRDLTERKQNLKKLSDSRQKYASLLDVAPVSLAELSLDSFFNYCFKLEEKYQSPIRKILRKKPQLVFALLRKMRVSSVNATMLMLLNIEKSEALYRGLTQIIPLSSCKEIGDFIASRWEGDGDAILETTLQKLSGQIINVRIRGVQIRHSLEDERSVIISVEDLTDLKNQAINLVKALEKAEEMDRLKTAFLANMSHEIRTPLAGVLGFSELLIDELEDEEHIEFCRHIYKGGKRLMETLTSMLEMARLESGESHLREVKVNVNDEVEAITDLLEPLARHKELDLICKLPVNFEVITLTDKSALRRIVENLVGNAIKFTSKGSVQVALEASDDWFTIYVVDTGVGIDDKFMSVIFNEFTQEDYERTRAYEGVGLGLSITRRLISLMNGTITVQSTKGTGSTFTVCLPLKVA